MDSLAGPVVRDGPIQRDSVAEVGVVAILLSQVFSIALLSRRQSGRKAAFTSTPEALDQTQRLGQTCVRQTRSHIQKKNQIKGADNLVKDRISSAEKLKTSVEMLLHR